MLEGLADSIAATSLLADLAVYIDDDEEEVYAEALKAASERVTVRPVIGPRLGPCGSLNDLVKRNPGYNAYGAATDDCQFSTPDWDLWVLHREAEYADGITAIAPCTTVAACRTDSEVPGNPLENRMDFPWVTGRWIEVVGWLCFPGAYAFYWDVVVEVMGKMTRIVYATQDEFEITHEEHTPINSAKLLLDAKESIEYLAYFAEEPISRLRKEMAVAAEIA